MNVPGRELLPIIRAALERGQRVRMIANGSSMLPFIHDGDTIEIEPPRACPRLGDILLVEGEGERYVVHRVVEVKGDTFFLRGDSQAQSEGPYAHKAVRGKVTASHRRGRTRGHDRGLWRFAGLVWLHTAPLGDCLVRLARPLWRLSKWAQHRLQCIRAHSPARSWRQ